MDHGPLAAQLLELAPEAVLGVDADGRIVLVNAQLERWVGYTRAELQGRSVEMLVADDARRRHHRMRSRYQEHPHLRPMGAGLALVGRRKDGATFPVEISLGPGDLRAALDELASAEHDLHVSASFGAVALEEADDPDHALALADAALYRAKAAR